MDAKLLGERIRQAREEKSYSQEDVRRALELGDRTAVSRMESGDRRVSAAEMFALAALLDKPLQWFVMEPVPAVISRRTDAGHDAEVIGRIDADLVLFADDVRSLLSKGLLAGTARPAWGTPRDHDAAARIARQARAVAGIGDEPIDSFGAVCEKLGMYVFYGDYGGEGGDGACVRVDAGTDAAVAVAVINGGKPSGRRRMTAAHELAHWLVGDAYDRHSSESESLIKSVAVHFLMPDTGIRRIWAEYAAESPRDRAVRIAGTYRASWSAVTAQLRNLGLISEPDHRRLAEDKPQGSEFAVLRIAPADNLKLPQLSPALAAAIVRGYRDAKLTRSRALQMLRGAISDADLRQRDDSPFGG